MLDENSVCFKDYDVVEKIGQGGMGEVFKAIRKSDGRIVALKRILCEFRSDKQEAYLARFRREIEISRTLSHPNIVRVIDGAVEDENGVNFIAMEYVEGSSLFHLGERQYDITLLLNVMCQISGALEYLHARRIYHRDIKPQNILVDKSGNAILVDFGLALNRDYTRLTNTGEFLGTLVTVAPEQLLGEKIDGRADIYSLGATAYLYVAGVPPFSTVEVLNLAAGRTPQSPPSLREILGSFPGELDEIISKCLCVDRSLRFQSAQDILVALESVRDSTSLLSGTKAERTSSNSTLEAVKNEPLEKERSRRYLFYLLLSIVIIFSPYIHTKLQENRRLVKSDRLDSPLSLSLLRENLIENRRAVNKENLKLLGSFVKASNDTRRLQLDDTVTEEQAGTYYLAVYTKQKKMIGLSRKLYEQLLNGDGFESNKPLRDRVEQEYHKLVLEISGDKLLAWYDEKPSEKRTGVAKDVIMIVKPIAHIVTVHSFWTESSRQYIRALRMLDTDEAREEAVNYLKFCQTLNIPHIELQKITMEVVGLLRAQRGIGVECRRRKHLLKAKELTLDVLKNTQDEDERWGITLVMADLCSKLGERCEAEKVLKDGITRSPQFENSIEHIHSKASIAANIGLYKKAIAHIVRILRKDLSSSERRRFERILLEMKAFDRITSK